MSLTLPKRNTLGKGSLCCLTAEPMHQGLQKNEEAIYKTSPKAPEFLKSFKMELTRMLFLLEFPWEELCLLITQTKADLLNFVTKRTQS